MELEKEKLQKLLQQAKKLSETHEILLLTSNEDRTDNPSDYVGYSVKSEFYSEEDELKILDSLYKIGFSVQQFFNEEDFISFVSANYKKLQKVIVINSAQKGIKIGRKSLIPAICDLYGIRYVGSNPYVVSLCRDKYRCGCILAQNHIPVPKAWLYSPVFGWLDPPTIVKSQVIIKPNYEAASIGIDASSICKSDTIDKKVKQLQSIYCQDILAEEFISGYEVEIPVIISGDGPIAFFPVGIKLGGSRRMGRRILDYELRKADAYEFYDFTNENPEIARKAVEVAIATALTLSIRGFSRIDCRIKDDGSIYVTDVATNPHYTEKSSYRFLFSQLGFDYTDLISCLIASSFEEENL